MVTVNNITEYRQIQARRAAKLRKLQKKGPTSAAKHMATKCRQFAPRFTGNVIRSIVRRRNVVSVGGKSVPSKNWPSGFPYIHWINATPGSGLETVAYKKRYGDKKKYSFAQAARNKSTVGFFWKAERSTRKFFRNSMIRNTRNILRSKY